MIWEKFVFNIQFVHGNNVVSVVIIMVIHRRVAIMVKFCTDKHFKYLSAQFLPVQT